MASLNPFERIRSTEGKVLLLLVGLAALMTVFDVAGSRTTPGVSFYALEALVVAFYIAIGTWGTMRVVARPVRRAVDHFARISRGDYSKPVLTRRTDEFGDMLRALDGMRLKLADAVRARDTAERRYQEIVERSVQGFFQTTIDGSVLAANDALATMLGFTSAAELIAQPRGVAKRLYVDPGRRATLMHQLQAEGFVTGFEVSLRRKDGLIIWASESARIVNDDQDEPLYIEGFLEDITERKETEQLKADFVSFVTHQLRTPLSGIRWMLELARDANPTGEVASFVDDAHASAQRLIGLVNDLLDIARLESGRLTTLPGPIDLQALSASIVDDLAPLAEVKRQRVDVTGQAALMAYADPQLTRQAVMNLISNAIKYTPAGGFITIDTRMEDKHVCCAVKDTGVGISPASQRRLFEKFYRADNAQAVDTEGTGLGLYLVKLIAERSGGSVSCQSSERGGSTFTLKLPVADEQKAIA